MPLSRARQSAVVLAILLAAAQPTWAQNPLAASQPQDSQEYWDLDIPMLEGGPLTAQQTRGKLLVIDVWGTWCGPCHKVIPKLIELQNQFQGKGVEVIGISAEVSGDYDTAVKRVKKYAAEKGINYRLGILDQRVYERIRSIMRFQNDEFTVPSTFVVDRSGLIIGRYPGYFVGQENEIADLLKQRLAAEAAGASGTP